MEESGVVKNGWDLNESREEEYEEQAKQSQEARTFRQSDEPILRSFLSVGWW